MTLSEKTEAEIKTEYWAKPGPSRNFDWMAFDAAWDGDTETAKHYAIGWGKTEAEAIADCRAEMEAREPVADPASAIEDVRADLREIMEG